MTERLELTADLISLGKALAFQLREESNGREDLLSRWIAQDLASKIKAAESEPENVELQRDCLDTILALWEHRAVFPHEKRTTAKYETILQTIERLDPTSRSSFYFSRDVELTGDGAHLLESALSIDRAARALISHCLSWAADISEDDNDWSKLARAAGLEESPDMQVIRILLTGDDDRQPSGLEVRRDRIKNLQKSLGRFRKVSRLIGERLKLEREEIEAELRKEKGN